MSWLSTLWFLGDDFLLIFERRSSTSNMGQLSITFDQRMNMSGERAGKIMVCSLFKLIIYTLLVHENERQFHRIGVGDRLKKGCLNLARCLPAHWIWAFYLCQINWITNFWLTCPFHTIEFAHCSHNLSLWLVHRMCCLWLRSARSAPLAVTWYARNKRSIKYIITIKNDRKFTLMMGEFRILMHLLQAY